jgi:hypothetical protein
MWSVPAKREPDQCSNTKEPCRTRPVNFGSVAYMRDESQGMRGCPRGIAVNKSLLLLRRRLIQIIRRDQSAVSHGLPLVSDRHK